MIYAIIIGSFVLILIVGTIFLAISDIRATKKIKQAQEELMIQSSKKAKQALTKNK